MEPGNEKNDETNPSNPPANDAAPKSDEKESIEERYNKLRGFAVKLKKKVSDLSEQLQKSETERNRANIEREELQNKVLQISDNAKKLQAIQSEYDKLQDDLEQQKSENKKITKNLESVVNDNASLKESIYEKKESIARLNAEIEKSSKERVRLETALKQSQETVKGLKDAMKAELVIREQRDKEHEETRSALNAEIDAHKRTRAQLDSSKQECTTKSVLSLEVENYERSVEDLKTRLDEENSKRIASERTVELHLETISSLNKQIAELRDICLVKTNKITVLGEKNEDIKQELCEVQRKAAEQKTRMEGLVEELTVCKLDKDQLLKELESLEVRRDRENLEAKLESQKYREEVKSLEAEISRLNTTLTSNNEELEALRAEFNGYKLRAQSVLRTKQSQSKESGFGGRSVAEVEEELEHARTHAALLRDKLENYTERVETLTRELTMSKDERDRAREGQRECNQRLSVLSQELSSVMEQLRSEANKRQHVQAEHKEELELLRHRHKNEIAAVEEKWQQEIQNLQMEMQKAIFSGSRETAVTPNVAPSDRQTSEAISESDQNPRLSGMSLIEREEGEGSESVDSCPSAVTNAERYRKRSLMPLDELLNSSDDCKAQVDQAFSPTVDRQSLEVYERRVRHLTALLADAERDVAKLTQLNQILKEDIRRQRRSIEREQHANNFEYLKNVVFKFVTLKNGDERSHLIPVLTTILKLSPEETQKLNGVAGVSGRSWIPGIPIPGWNNI